MKIYVKSGSNTRDNHDWASELHEDLKDVDTSEWSEMIAYHQEDEIRNAGSYNNYILNERKWMNRY